MRAPRRRTSSTTRCPHSTCSASTASASACMTASSSRRSSSRCSRPRRRCPPAPPWAASTSTVRLPAPPPPRCGVSIHRREGLVAVRVLRVISYLIGWYHGCLLLCAWHACVPGSFHGAQQIGIPWNADQNTTCIRVDYCGQYMASAVQRCSTRTALTCAGAGAASRRRSLRR